MTAKDKAKELVYKFRCKFLAKMYCSLFIWLIDGSFLKKVKQEIEKL
jgi:hypothetical protein